MANTIGELWLSYGRDSFSTGMAMMRGEADVDVCTKKYAKPYLKE